MMTRMGGWEGGGVSTPHKVLGCDFHARPHQPPGPLSNLSCDVLARSHNIPLSWSKWFLQRPQHTPRALKMWYSYQVPWFPTIIIKMMFSVDNTVTWCLVCVIPRGGGSFCFSHHTLCRRYWIDKIRALSPCASSVWCIKSQQVPRAHCCSIVIWHLLYYTCHHTLRFHHKFTL